MLAMCLPNHRDLSQNCIAGGRASYTIILSHGIDHCMIREMTSLWCDQPGTKWKGLCLSKQEVKVLELLRVLSGRPVLGPVCAQRVLPSRVYVYM